MPSVLIVDDQSTNRRLVEQLVRSLPAKLDIHSFSDPVEALSHAKNNPPDLIITDIRMPNMNGFEFLRWIRNIPVCQNVPAIAITVDDNLETRYRALDVGATDFLTKPIDHYEFKARCKNLLTLRLGNIF